MRNIKPGDIGLFQDRAGATRQALVLAVTPGEECICTLLHDFRKGQMVQVGSRFCDPTDLMKKQADAFITTAVPVSADELHIVRATMAKSIGLDISQAGMSSDLRKLMIEKAKLEAEVQTLTLYRELYEQFLETVCDRLSGPSEPQTKQKEGQPQPALSHAEKERINRMKRRERYAPLQAYIDVKLKAMKLSRNQADAMLGYAPGTISHWILGDALAKWDELAQIPALANIKAEAEEWLDSQSKEGKGQ